MATPCHRTTPMPWPRWPRRSSFATGRRWPCATRSRRCHPRPSAASVSLVSSRLMRESAPSGGRSAVVRGGDAARGLSMVTCYRPTCVTGSSLRRFDSASTRQPPVSDATYPCKSPFPARWFPSRRDMPPPAASWTGSVLGGRNQSAQDREVVRPPVFALPIAHRVAHRDLGDRAGPLFDARARLVQRDMLLQRFRRTWRSAGPAPAPAHLPRRPESRASCFCAGSSGRRQPPGCGSGRCVPG
jgi:hypothetical protein